MLAFVATDASGRQLLLPTTSRTSRRCGINRPARETELAVTIRAGQTLLHYRVVEKIGAGGMGEVYRAEDTRLGRHVAIKVLPAELRHDPHRLARLEREARLLAALNHPHIATLHGLEESADGTRFLVMELVEDETLATRLHRGEVPLRELYTWGAEISDALAAAHERGIVHRDLKPGNIMLTRAGVKLLDFGLAKATNLSGPGALTETRARGAASDPLTGEGTFLGTVLYMAPEQLEGREADARSDIWALGTVLHEMATRRPAFDAEVLAESTSSCSSVPSTLEGPCASRACTRAPSTRRATCSTGIRVHSWLAHSIPNVRGLQARQCLSGRCRARLLPAPEWPCSALPERAGRSLTLEARGIWSSDGWTGAETRSGGSLSWDHTRPPRVR